jgi:hypothetical protein
MPNANRCSRFELCAPHYTPLYISARKADNSQQRPQGMIMRNLFALLLLICAALPAMAADRPGNLQPIPDPPPPPPGFEIDPALEPQVTIIKRGTDTVEEYRVAGKLYMLKVTPAHGAPYYLIDEKGDGKMSRQETFDFGVRPPMWVIHSW